MTYSWEHRTLFFSGRKLGIEVNGAKQVNVPNFYLTIQEFKGIQFEFLKNIFFSILATGKRVVGKQRFNLLDRT